MDFAYSPRTEELLGKLESFMADYVYPAESVYDAQVAANDNPHEQPQIMRDLQAKARELGLWNLFMTHDGLGAGLTNLEYAPLAEIVGRSIIGNETINCSAPDTGNMEILAMFGTDEQKAQWLKPLLDCSIRSAFAMTEPAVASSDATNIRSTIQRDGDEYVLNGRKCFITNAPYADLFVIFAMTKRGVGHRGISAFIVEGDRPGLSRGPHEKKMGLRGAAAGDVILEDVFVPDENLLGEEGKGFKLAMQTLDASRVIVGISAVGIAQSAIDHSVEYAKNRICFGKPIANLQAIQFMLADMEIQTQAARALCYAAAEAYDNGKPFTKLAAAAKCMGGDTAMKVTTDAVQILSGYGYMRDYPVEKLMRDAKLFQIFEGTNQVQRVVVSGNMLK